MLSLTIRKFAFDSAKLVGDLSTVEGEKKLTDYVLDRLKTTEKLILHDSTATESKEQVFDYIKEVITEIKKIRGM